MRIPNQSTLDPGFAWIDRPETSEALVKAIRDWPDLVARGALIASLMDSIQLDDPAGVQALYQVAMGDGLVLVSIGSCQSALHRSFWTYVNERELFERACDIAFFDRNKPQTQLNELGLHRVPDHSGSALEAFQRTIEDFYQEEMQCGECSVAYLIEREPRVYLLSVHVKDHAAIHLEFQGSTLTRRVGNPQIQMMLEYSVTTGAARTYVRGGNKYHAKLLDAFSAHLLGETAEARRILPPTLDLSVLRAGFQVPAAMTDGFCAMAVKSITLLSPSGQLRMVCTVAARNSHDCVTDILREELPNDDPLAAGWLITAAQINLYYPPRIGNRGPRVVSVEVTRRGRLNLHKFDPKLQAQLEGYLVTAGILQPGHTLHAQEVAEDLWSPVEA